MAVLEITQNHFSMLAAACREQWRHKSERAWFAGIDDAVVGVLYQDPETNRWGYAVCRKNNGGFDCVNVVADLDRADLARLALISNMRRPADPSARTAHPLCL
jgi:hypothetical protein